MTTETNYDMQRQIAADVLTKAGDRAASQKRNVDFSVKTESDFHDILDTVATTVQDDVISALKRIFPDYGVLTEDDRRRQDADFRWVLDPIDGTQNYARGLPLWGLSLALLHRNQAVVGVIAIPDNTETYSASLGGRSYRNATPIEVTKPRALHNAIVAITWGSDAPHKERMLKAADGLVRQAADVLSVGASAIALSWLAAGKVDAVVASGDIWDFAAGFLISKQMGAVVTEWNGTKPTFRERDFFTLVSTNQPLHDELVTILKDR